MEENEINIEEKISGSPSTSLGVNFTAKKSLGQNFLHAPAVIGAMIHSGNIHPGDIVLEVGPGKGALTEKLLAAGAQVIAVEKDDRAIPFLSEKFAGKIKEGNLKIIHGDILEMTTESLGLEKGKYVIIANIPYYISGEFLRKFLEAEAQPLRIVVMLQKELAKRIVETKGSILSISVKAYGNPKYVVAVPRQFFRPMPNVDSAVLLIENISKNFFESIKKEANVSENSEKSFFEIVKAGFAHKRKVLVKNLEEKMSKEAIGQVWKNEKWPLTVRAEELNLDAWKKISISSFCFPQK